MGALGRVRVWESLWHDVKTSAAEKEEDARRGMLKVNSVTAYVGHDVVYGSSTVKSNAEGSCWTLVSVKESDPVHDWRGSSAARSSDEDCLVS